MACGRLDTLRESLRYGVRRIGRDGSGATFRRKEVESSDDRQTIAINTRSRDLIEVTEASNLADTHAGSPAMAKSSKDDNSIHLKHAHQRPAYISACALAPL
jgi:hypothetical protein